MKFLYIFLIVSLISLNSHCKAIIVDKVEDIQKYVDEGQTNESFHVLDRSKLKKIRYTDKNVPELVWEEGMVASLAHYEEIGVARMKGQLKEISCLENKFLTPCGLQTNFLYQHYRMVWKSHPDKKMINKSFFLAPAPYEKENFPGARARNPIMRNYIRHYEDFYTKFKLVTPESDLVDDMKPPIIRCQSKDWMSELSDKYGERNKHLDVLEWVTEQMVPNPETGVSENVTTGSAFNVKMNFAQDGLVLNDISYISASTNGSLFAGDIVGWGLDNGKQYCDLSFTFDLSQFGKAFQDINKKVTPKSLMIVDRLAKPVLSDLQGALFSSLSTLTEGLDKNDPIVLNAKYRRISDFAKHESKFFKKAGTEEEFNISYIVYEFRELKQ